MTVAGFVLVCALDLLGRSSNLLPPIILLDERPEDASANAVAFVRRGERAIYLITSTPIFRSAIDANRHQTNCRSLDALRMIASVIVHEEWHLVHGSDERAAYLAQLNELQRLGAGPGRWPYETVRKAMISTLERYERIREANRVAALEAPSASATLNAAPSSDPAWPPAGLEWTRPALRPR